MSSLRELSKLTSTHRRLARTETILFLEPTRDPSFQSFETTQGRQQEDRLAREEVGCVGVVGRDQVRSSRRRVELFHFVSLPFLPRFVLRYSRYVFCYCVNLCSLLLRSCFCSSLPSISMTLVLERVVSTNHLHPPLSQGALFQLSIISSWAICSLPSQFGPTATRDLRI